MNPRSGWLRDGPVGLQYHRVPRCSSLDLIVEDDGLDGPERIVELRYLALTQYRDGEFRRQTASCKRPVCTLGAAVRQ